MEVKNKGKYYITTAIAYTSKIPHIGNTYEAVLADAIARFRRLEGYDVYFLTGTDEHGQKIQDQAKQEGKTPQEHVDYIASEIRRIWDFMNVSYDQFIRTTDPKHKRIVQKIFKKLHDNGDIYKHYYEGYYCKACESFYTETQVADSKCPDCGASIEKAREEAYFFKLSKYADRLEKYINDNPSFIQPESRKNEMINNFIKPGLQDLCVSRTSFSWGVPVDFDEKHVVYVWIDALSNYITALGYDPDGENGELFNKYWPADAHLIGKDIVRFHTIYWPIMLMALDVELPKQVFGHPWLLFGDDKMSKSKGNVINAEELVRYFGVDAVRYYLLHEMPFASDGSFTYELIMSRTNSDLANILGNLVNRTIAMVNKYFDGTVPSPAEKGEFDEELISIALDTPKRVSHAMESLHVADALDEIWTLLRRSNKYIDETMPWSLSKNEEDKARLGTVLYNLLEAIRIASVLIAPFLPDTAKKIQAQLGTDAIALDTLNSFDGIIPGSKVGQAEVLFARIDEAEKIKEIEADLSKNVAASEAKPEKSGESEKTPEITIDEFFKTELTVGQVLECEKVEKSDKLLKSIIDLGSEKRQILSGIAQWYSPEEMVGKKVIVVSNLKPAKIRGLMSEGMVLAAENSDGSVFVLEAPEGTNAGDKIR